MRRIACLLRTCELDLPGLAIAIHPHVNDGGRTGTRHGRHAPRRPHGPCDSQAPNAHPKSADITLTGSGLKLPLIVLNAIIIVVDALRYDFAAPDAPLTHRTHGANHSDHADYAHHPDQPTILTIPTIHTPTIHTPTIHTPTRAAVSPTPLIA